MSMRTCPRERLALALLALPLLLSGCGSDELIRPLPGECLERETGTFENCLEPHAPIFRTGTWVIRTEEEYEEFLHHGVCHWDDPDAHNPPLPTEGEILVAAAFARTACQVCLEISCALPAADAIRVELGGGSSGSCPDYFRMGVWALIPETGLPVEIDDPFDLPHAENSGPCR